MSKTLAMPVNFLLEIKKSRFMGRVEPILSSEEGLQIVQALRQQHPEATHVCYSLLANGQVKQSDDGEPSGTAASPMLNVLQHKDLDNVLATVVRYFGGVKLGAGGLVRAYSQAISEPLQQAVYVDLTLPVQLKLAVAFEHESLLRRLAEQQKISLAINYTHEVIAAIEGEDQALNRFLEGFSEQVRGQLRLLE
ncbi:MAG TPA: YigZ family protein [Marinospirillum sp.]|uniref:IMPACT family protein n=1 Tax=Marinospirillum sp. TaxID=2183934 RepID=UPI002B474E65|nr:YigZ family protein [Marinospirillum sp.]HKM15672.1 YigZ family protein [Marinospirillum sp.]